MDGCREVRGCGGPGALSIAGIFVAQIASNRRGCDSGDPFETPDQRFWRCCAIAIRLG